MALPDFTGQFIQDTYQRVLQVSGSGDIVDGTGSLFIPPNAISASYAVSASVEIIKEVSSSHANFADTASLAYTASYVNPLNQDIEITGSTVITGSLFISPKDPTGTSNFYVTDLTGSTQQAIQRIGTNAEGLVFQSDTKNVFITSKQTASLQGEVTTVGALLGINVTRSINLGVNNTIPVFNNLWNINLGGGTSDTKLFIGASETKVSGALSVDGTSRTLFTSCSMVYSGSNVMQVTQSYEAGTQQITNILYSGSFSDGNPLEISVTGSDGINKLYSMTYSGSNITQILVT